MSRAFVKEDAQAAPVQWRKAAAGADGRVALTLSGANRLKDELARLKAGERPSSPPNGEATQRVALLEDVLARAEVIDARKQTGDRITFGATVVLQNVDGESRSKYRIVGEVESDLKAGRVSVTSPLGRALIGHEVGDLIEVKAPGGGRDYEIVELSWVEDGGSPNSSQD